MRVKLIWSIFGVLVLDFMFLLANATILVVAQWSNNYMFLAVLAFALFLFLGIALLVLALKGKLAGLLKKFLVLTASASIAITIGFVVLEVVPPLIADMIFWAIVAAFLAGVVGSIVFSIKKSRPAKKSPSRRR
jgi:hypothetical protein